MKKRLLAALMLISILSSFVPPVYAIEGVSTLQTQVSTNDSGKSWFQVWHEPTGNWRALMCREYKWELNKDYTFFSEYDASTIFRDYTAEEYMEAYLALKRARVDDGIRELQDIRVTGMNQYIESTYGLSSEVTSSTPMPDPEAMEYRPLNFPADMIYMEDFFLVAFFRKFSQGGTYAEIKALLPLLEKIEDNRAYSENFFGMIQTIPGYEDVTNQYSLIYTAESSAIVLSADLAQEFQDERIYQNYIKDRTVDDFGYDGLDKAIRTATVLSWEKVTDYPQTLVTIGEAIGVQSLDRLELLTELYSLVKDNLTVQQQVYVYSVIRGRGYAQSYHSYTGSQRLFTAPATYTEIEPNAQAETSARNLLEDSILAINIFAGDSGATEERKQRVTLSYRLRYHYYAMQSSLHASEQEVVDRLSYSEGVRDTEGTSVHVAMFDPIEMNNTPIYSAKQYTLFMNTVNELTHLRGVLFAWGNGIDDWNAITRHTTDVINKAIYMKQFKSAITFLESIPEYGLDPVIDLWYQKAEGELSLEEIYRKVIDLGINEEELSIDGETYGHRPMDFFFDTETSSLNLFIRLGISNSAHYLPLKTNVYDPYTYRNIKRDDFFNQFHYIWGYNRKALYIDTRVNSAVETFNTGIVGDLRVATLKDLLEVDKDITLYTDTSYYNANKLVTLVEKVVEAGIDVGARAQRIADTGENLWQYVEEITSLSLVSLVEHTVSDTLEALSNLATPYEGAVGNFAVFSSNPVADVKFMSKEQIVKYLHQEDYTEEKAFAVTSAIVRDKALAQYIKDEEVEPVFVSSKNLAVSPGASNREHMSYYNYILLKNISGEQLINFRSNMDYNSPVYMDVYGNIVTESGYVVIPAAANASLMEDFSPLTSAFLSNYGKSYTAKGNYDFIAPKNGSGSNFFIYDEVTRTYELKSLKVNDVIDLKRLSTATVEAQKQLYTFTRLRLEKDEFRNKMFIVNVLLQVMRGAPIEFIDKEAEGIDVSDDVAKAGIVQAAKFSKLRESLDIASMNSVLAVPNIAFVEGIEYWIFLTYKIALVIALALVLIQIVVMVMTFNFNAFSILKIAGTVTLTIAVILAIPVTFDLTYYQINKLLLQPETEYIAMLNLEKHETGVEIGMTGVSEPRQDTELLLMVEDLEIPWHELFLDIARSNIKTSMTDLYEEKVKTHLLYGAEGLELREGKLYMGVDTLFDTSTVMFDPEFKTLYQKTQGELPLAFYSPYYVFVNSLVGNINAYNLKNNIYSYSTQIYRNGKVMSLGLIEEYLTSGEFMSDDNLDLLHLRQIYGLPVDNLQNSPFSDEDVMLMRQTTWCDSSSQPGPIVDRIELLNKKARDFVAKNKDLLGRISDETFIKVMALSLALEHNQLFAVENVDSIEIYNLAPDDLVRLSLLPRARVMQGSPYDYPRFIYENVGLPGVYLASILDLVFFVSNWVKPLVTLLMFAVLFISIFVYRLILRRDSDNIKGMLKIFILLISTNLLYALVVKASLFLPNLGIVPAVSLIVQIVLHTIFILVFIWIVGIATSNWRDLGSGKVNLIALNAKGLTTGNRVYQALESKARNAKGSGWEKYRELKEKEQARKYKIMKEEDEI